MFLSQTACSYNVVTNIVKYRYPQPTSRSLHELSAGVYDSLPRSLKQPTIVRSKVEDPELQKERYELTRAKTPSELAAIRTPGDIPLPGLWEGDRGRASGRT